VETIQKRIATYGTPASTSSSRRAPLASADGDGLNGEFEFISLTSADID
jgi:hypothetical protein